MRKFRERSIVLKDCVITLLAVGAGRVVISVLIVMGMVSIPNRAENSGRIPHSIHPKEAMIIYSLNNWNFIWQLFYVNLDGANRRSKKVVIFVAKKINKGYGCDFAEMRDYPIQAKWYKFKIDTAYGRPAINSLDYKQIASIQEYNLKTDGFDSYLQQGYGYSHDYATVTEGLTGFEALSHSQSPIPKEPGDDIAPVQAREVSKLVTGMTSDQIITRLKQDHAFKQQIKDAAGADVWKAMQTKGVPYNK